MIALGSGQKFISERPGDAFKITKGGVDIFLLPREKGIPGRPMFVMHAEEGKTVPALSFEDQDYVQWNFQLEATEDCELKEIEGGNTGPLKKRFCREAGIGDEKGKGDMTKLLVESYMSSMISDDVLITKSEAQREKEKEAARDMMEQAAEGIGDPSEESVSEEKVSATAALSGDFSKGEWLGICAFAAAGVAPIAALVFSSGSRAFPFVLLAALVIYLLVQRLSGMVMDRWAQDKAFDVQKCLYEDLYREQAAPGKEDGQAEAAAILGNCDELRRARSRELQGEKALITAVGLMAFAASSFIIPAAISGLTVILGGGLLLQAKATTSARAAKASEAGNKARLGLLEALYHIEKIRLSGAVEHVIHRYYVGRNKEKQRERLKNRRLTTWESIAAVIIAFGSVLMIMSAAGLGSYSREGAMACMVCCGILIWEGIRAALFFAKAREMKPIIPSDTSGSENKKEEDRKPSHSSAAETFDALSPGECLLEADVLSFAYDDRKVCEDISLKLHKGEHLGIVGASGSGKSTLMKLLSGKLKPDQGNIDFLGRRLEGDALEDLKALSSVLLQNDQLLTTSIRENILLGAKDHRAVDLHRIAEDAGLTEDIKEMPMGLETLIREDGGNVSAGQKQKILIARALAGDPGIVFFDEAESELDGQQQEKLQKALGDRGVSMITISHQYPSVKNCDKIAVMREGRILEYGSPEELLDKKGEFFALMHRQM